MSSDQRTNFNYSTRQLWQIHCEPLIYARPGAEATPTTTVIETLGWTL